MSISAFDLDIANNALTKVGVANITSLNDNNTEAKVVKQHIASARDFVLQTWEWSALFGREILTPDPTATPVFDYLYSSPLPADFVSLRSLTDTNTTEVTKFEIEGRYILSDEKILWLRYNRDTWNVNKVPAYLKETIASYLASQIAFKLNPDERPRLIQEFDMVRLRARRAEYRNRSVDHYTSSRSSRAGTYKGI